MEIVFYIAICVLTLYLVYLAGQPNINFPYIFIIIGVVNELMLDHIIKFSGFGSIIRGFYMICIVVFILRMKIKTPWIFNVLFLYFGVFMFFFSGSTTIIGFFFKISYIFFTFSFFALGIILIKDENFIPKLLNVCRALPVIALLYYVIIYITGAATKGYSDEFTSGAISSARVNLLSFSGVVLFLFLYTRYIPKTLVNLIPVIVAFSLLILNAKRSSMLIAFLGLFITLVFFKVSMKKLLGFSLVSLIIIFVVSDLAGSIFSAQYEARSGRMTWEGIQDEGRYREYEVFPEYFRDNFGTKELLIGNGFVPNYDYRQKYLGLVQRSIHTDTIALLYSIGLIGYFIYLLFLVKVFATLRQAAKFVKASRGDLPALLIPLGYAMFTMAFVVNMVDRLFIIGSASSLVFMILGFMYGLTKVLKASKASYIPERTTEISGSAPSLNPAHPLDRNSV